MLRVIAGSAKGLQLRTPPGSVRPTLDRVREAVFSILHTQLPGARFADLYAGSGANGIEALSRGASMCVFVDADAHALDVIAENLAHTRLGHKSRSYRLTLPTSLGVLSGKEGPFDVVYADPPYDLKNYEALILQVIDNKLLAEAGKLIVEHDARHELPQSVGVLQQIRKARYGRVGITIFA